MLTALIGPVWGQTEPLVTEEGGYEIPPVLDAKEIVPPDLLKGEYWRVDLYVSTFGLENIYTITSDFGPFAAHGDDMLVIRIEEIRALAAMAEMKKSKQFTQAARKAGESPFKGVGNLILHPVDTVTGIPKGAWRYVTRIGQLARGQRGELEKSAFKASNKSH